MNEPVRATPKVASAEDLFTAGILGGCLPTGPNSVGLDLALHLTPSPLKASLCAFMLRMLNATSIEYRADTSDGDDSAVIPITVKLVMVSVTSLLYSCFASLSCIVSVNRYTT